MTDHITSWVAHGLAVAKQHKDDHPAYWAGRYMAEHHIPARVAYRALLQFRRGGK